MVILRMSRTIYIYGTLACTREVNVANMAFLINLFEMNFSRFVCLNWRIICLLTVLILSVRGILVRKFMLAAHDLEMTRGDWAFLDVEIFQVK